MIAKEIFNILKNKNKKTININFIINDNNNTNYEKYLILPNRINRTFKTFIFCKKKKIEFCKKMGYKEVFDPNLIKEKYFKRKRTKYILCQHEVYSIFKKKLSFFLRKKKIKMSYSLGNIFKDFKYLNFFKLGYISFLKRNLNYINTYFSDTNMCYKKFYENLIFTINSIKNDFYRIRKIFISNSNSKSFELDLNIIKKTK